MQRPADVNYTFSAAEIDLIRPYGEVRAHEEGAVLFSEGDRQIDLLVTLSGETHIVVPTKDGPQRLGWMEAGQFTGDVGILAGQATLATTTMGKAGEVLHVSYANLLRLLAESPAISDILIRTFTARRAFQHHRGTGAVVVLGPAYDRGVFTARDLLSKHNVAHNWFDPDQTEIGRRVMEAKGLTAADLPAVVLGESRILVRPGVVELSEALGLDLIPDDASADVIVVGAGPGGLAAAVYAASEGLSVVTVDAEGPGGQAGTSSKIENSLGFPTGVSGRELASRAAVQAQKFGVRMATPAKAAALDRLDD
ncbi:MAG: cyclic nucleotide-binding domain-containing protein, partial [Pseudomonadota bacterium]